MQRISIKHLKSGMIVARNIYDADGHKLLSKDVVLNEQYIARLHNLAIPAVYVKFSNDDDIDYPDDIVSEQTRVRAIKNLNIAFHKCQLTNTVDLKIMKQITRNILDSLLVNRTNIVQMNDIRCYDDYTFAHSVNVCILSTMLAISCQYSTRKLREISLGALLHDVGKIKIPHKILNKPASLSDEEFAVIKKHSEYGFDILRQSHDMSIVPMHIAFQHHEKFNGTGYPRGLKGTEIHEYARIVAIADVYDALTSDRPYKNACAPYEAYKIMVQSSNLQFDNVLLEKFFSYIAVFPVGSIVQLNTGEYALVVGVEQGFTFSPTVKLLTTANRELIEKRITLNLKLENMPYIDHMLCETDSIEFNTLLYNKKSD